MQISFAFPSLAAVALLGTAACTIKTTDTAPAPASTTVADPTKPAAPSVDETPATCPLQAPQAIAPNEDAPSAIVADATHAYWIRYAQQELVRAPVDGSAAPEKLAGAVAGYDLAIDDDSVYALVAGNVVALSKADPTKSTKLGTATSLRGIAARNHQAAWASRGGVDIWDGTTTKHFGDSGSGFFTTSGMRNVAMDEKAIYSGASASTVARYGYDGSTQAGLALSAGDALKVGAQYVYSASFFADGVSYVPKAGGDAVKITRGEAVDLNGRPAHAPLLAIDIAVDGDVAFVLTREHGVQWVTPGETQAHALSSRLTSSNVDEVAGNNGVAVNATHVFWTARGADAASTSGTVYRIKRCR